MKKTKALAKKIVDAKLSKNVNRQLKESVSTAVVVSNFEKRAKPNFKKLQAVTKITSEDEKEIVATNLKQLKEIRKEAKEQKDGMLKGIKDSMKAIDNFFKPFENKVDTQEEEAKNLLLDWENAKEAKILKLNKDFEEGKINRISTYTRRAEALESKKGSAVKVRYLQRVSIVDEKAIPRKFMTPDLDVIEEALLSGKSVPGAKMVKVKSFAV